MGKTQVEIFATSSDIEGIVKAVEAEFAVSFAVMGLFESDAVRRFDSWDALARGLTVASVSGILIVERSAAILTREVPQRKGGPRFSIDQLNNSQSVVLRPGRMVSESILEAGQIGTVSRDPSSINLFSALRRVVNRQFVKVKSYWVGPEALRLLDAGARLATKAHASPEYDLKR